MKTSLIINTASLDPLVRTNQNPYRQQTYGSRAQLLTEQIIPKVKGQFDEIIIAGIFQEGEGYTYVPVQPRYRDRRDALYQREYGARHATGDVLVFCHDDHTPVEGFGTTLRQEYLDGFMCSLGKEATNPDCQCGGWHHPPEWDLLIPLRRHHLTGETLNNGKDDGYMGGHCFVMRRWLWAEVPWLRVDTEWWDVPMTRLWLAAGAKMLWVEDLIHVDLEATENER